jgi:D-3-phosphoglycerate dehydrogenase
MTKILIIDSLDKFALDSFEKAGYTVKYDPSISASSLKNEISTYEILIVRSTKVNREAIEAGESLKLIIRAGAGFDNIDVEIASKYGIHVCNTPGMNNDAVAELAIGHIIACDRHIPQNTQYIKSGEWRKKDFMNSRGLRERALGVIGCGNIGKALIRIAKSLQMKVIGWSFGFTKEEAEELGIEYAETILDVAKNSDVVSIHLAYFEKFHHFINQDFFDSMKEGSIFVNTSRGEIVDTNALIEGIRNKNLKVGFDVFEKEPTEGIAKFEQSELADLVCSATCHIGASTLQASQRIATETINVVEQFVKTGEPLHCVNSL